jgi:DNA-binding Lrp family transcriptional regulator
VGVQAYVLIQTNVGRSTAVAKEISNLPGVVSAADATGPYDVIVKVEAADMDALGQMIVTRLQMVDGVTRTLTCPIVRL